ncbi:pancreatic lipase-related protein 2-like [Cydia pomonella]|uniref:pancreatic lipase-related protein 2-like n=1 Tax=Cydia pomonella TaxID=82600 RepID=UPI002ADE19D1|nr:pancreatic lipase-related protein 2-like [Cydia pomonella]
MASRMLKGIILRCLLVLSGMSVQYAAIICCLVESVFGVTSPDAAKFSLSSLYDVALPVLHPIIAAGSDRCGTLKSLLGITYEQMQEKNRTNYQEISIDHITKNGNVKYNMTAAKRLSRFMSDADTVVVLVHGFLESSDGWMVNALAPEYLKKSGYKVLALDGRRAISFEYFSASTHARFIGEKLGNFLSELVENGQDPSKLILIGHSLGAHIAGVAGKRLQQNTGQQASRITGLDPAGPCFSKVDVGARLDRGDAAYVDVVHTNAGMLGIKEPVGHKDFYPNGGMTQPGCLLATCDHTRAWELLAEAISAPNDFPARKCENRTLFQNGLCAGNELAYMGNSAGSPGTYYFNTAASSPFGLREAGSGIK